MIEVKKLCKDFNGGELKERNVGSISKADLAKKIDALL